MYGPEAVGIESSSESDILPLHQKHHSLPSFPHDLGILHCPNFQCSKVQGHGFLLQGNLLQRLHELPAKEYKEIELRIYNLLKWIVGSVRPHLFHPLLHLTTGLKRVLKMCQPAREYEVQILKTPSF